MTSGFSAGPWRFDTNPGPETCIIADDSRLPDHEIHVICFGHDYDDYGRFDRPHVRRNIRTEKEAEVERDTNKRLILKAPDLFNLCRLMLFFYESPVPPNPSTSESLFRGVREVLHWIEGRGSGVPSSVIIEDGEQNSYEHFPRCQCGHRNLHHQAAIGRCDFCGSSPGGCSEFVAKDETH